MEPILSAPCTPAQRQRDLLLGALVGLARSTVNEPKTEDTDRVLAAGLRQAANADATEEALARMTRIVETEKHRVAPKLLSPQPAHCHAHWRDRTACLSSIAALPRKQGFRACRRDKGAIETDEV